MTRKSNNAIKNNGRVFTPGFLVDYMLDLAGYIAVFAYLPMFRLKPLRILS